MKASQFFFILSAIYMVPSLGKTGREWCAIAYLLLATAAIACEAAWALGLI